MTNKELYQIIRNRALSSVYWSRKQEHYFERDILYYAPMVENWLFNSLFDSKAVVGVMQLEKALKRKINVEELAVCPLSVRYFLFGSPVITESPKEKERLIKFSVLIDDKINRYEERTKKYLNLK